MIAEGARSIASDAVLDTYEGPSIDVSVQAESKWPPHSGRPPLNMTAPRGSILSIPLPVAVEYMIDAVYDRFEKIRRQQSASMRAAKGSAATPAEVYGIRQASREYLISAAHTSRLLVARMLSLVRWSYTAGRAYDAMVALSTIRAAAASEEGLAHVSGAAQQLGTYAHYLSLPTPDIGAAIAATSASSYAAVGAGPSADGGASSGSVGLASSTGIPGPLKPSWRALQAAASASAGPESMSRALEILHPGAADRLGSATGTLELSAVRARRRLRWEPGCDGMQIAPSSAPAGPISGSISIDERSGTVTLAQQGGWSAVLRLVPRSQPVLDADEGGGEGGGMSGPDCIERWYLLRAQLRFADGKGNAAGIHWYQLQADKWVADESSNRGSSTLLATSSSSSGLHRDWNQGAPMLHSAVEARSRAGPADDLALAERWLGLVRTCRGPQGAAATEHEEWGEDTLQPGPRTVLKANPASVARLLVSASASLERAAMAELNGHPASPLLDLSQQLAAAQADLCVRSLLAQASWTSRLSALPAGQALQSSVLRTWFAPQQRQLLLSLGPMHSIVDARQDLNKQLENRSALSGAAEAYAIGQALAAMAYHAVHGAPSKGAVGAIPWLRSIVSVRELGSADTWQRRLLAALAGTGALRGVHIASAMALHGGFGVDLSVDSEADGTYDVGCGLLGGPMLERVLASGGPVRMGRLLAQAREGSLQSQVESIRGMLRACNLRVDDGAEVTRSMTVAQIGSDTNCSLKFEQSGAGHVSVQRAGQRGYRPGAARTDSEHKAKLEQAGCLAVAAVIQAALDAVAKSFRGCYSSDLEDEISEEQAWSEIATAATCIALNDSISDGVSRGVKARLVAEAMRQAGRRTAALGSVDPFVRRVRQCILQVSDEQGDGEFESAFERDFLKDVESAEAGSDAVKYTSPVARRASSVYGIRGAHPTGALSVIRGPDAQSKAFRPVEPEPMKFSCSKGFWDGPFAGTHPWLDQPPKVPEGSAAPIPAGETTPGTLDQASLDEACGSAAKQDHDRPAEWLRSVISSKSVPGGSLFLAGEWIRRRRGLGAGRAGLQLTVANCCAAAVDAVRSAMHAVGAIEALSEPQPEAASSASSAQLQHSQDTTVFVPLPRLAGLRLEDAGGGKQSCDLPRRFAAQEWAGNLFGKRLSVALSPNASQTHEGVVLLRGPPVLSQLAIAGVLEDASQVEALLPRARREIARAERLLERGRQVLRGAGAEDAQQETPPGNVCLVVPVPFEACLPARQALALGDREGADRAAWAIARTGSRVRTMRRALLHALQEEGVKSVASSGAGTGDRSAGGINGIVLVPDLRAPRPPAFSRGDEADTASHAGGGKEGVDSASTAASVAGHSRNSASVIGSKRSRHDASGSRAPQGPRDPVAAAARSWVRRLREVLVEQQGVWSHEEVVVVAMRALLGSIAPDAAAEQGFLALSSSEGLLQRAEATTWCMAAASAQAVVDECVSALGLKGSAAAVKRAKAVLPAAAPAPMHGSSPPLPTASSLLADALVTECIKMAEPVVAGLPPDKQPRTSFDRASSIAAAADYFLGTHASASEDEASSLQVKNTFGALRLKRVLLDAGRASVTGRLRSAAQKDEEEVKQAGDAPLLSDPTRARAIPALTDLAGALEAVEQPSTEAGSTVGGYHGLLPLRLEESMEVAVEGEEAGDGVLQLDIAAARRVLYGRLQLQVPLDKQAPAVRTIAVRARVPWAVRVPVQRVRPHRAQGFYGALRGGDSDWRAILGTSVARHTLHDLTSAGGDRLEEVSALAMQGEPVVAGFDSAACQVCLHYPLVPAKGQAGGSAVAAAQAGNEGALLGPEGLVLGELRDLLGGACVSQYSCSGGDRGPVATLKAGAGFQEELAAAIALTRGVPAVVRGSPEEESGWSIRLARFTAYTEGVPTDGELLEVRKDAAAANSWYIAVRYRGVAKSSGISFSDALQAADAFAWYIYC